MPSYERDRAQFEGKDAQVVCITVDNIPSNQAWWRSLKRPQYAMLLSDFWPHGAVAQRYGVLRSEGVAERAVFVIDKTGVIRYIDVHDIRKQPENSDALAVLAGLET